jgi:hypothetical protein
VTEVRTFWENIKVEGGELLERVKELIHEGNVRRIIIRQGDRSVAEFPLTVGLVGTVGAPILAAVGALAALLTNCSIAVERERTTAGAGSTVPPSADTPAVPVESDPIFRDDIPPQA